MNLKDISLKIYDERQLKAITGLSVEQFFIILPIFDKLILEEKENNKKKKVKPNNGNEGKLEKSKDKLIFLLYYLKCYPTFDQLGFNFNMNKSCAHTWLYKIFPPFIKTLSYLEVLPETEFKTPEEMKEAFKDVNTLIIDATERVIQRPVDDEVQNEHYSGKRKIQANKNTVISNSDRYVLYLGPTFPGKNHDYGMFKKEFNPKLDWFKDFNIRIDLGYYGFDKDYITKNTFIPHKKPRKSKNNPNTKLSGVQKYENREMNKKRVIVENSIAGIKRYRCVVDKFRNHIPFMKDLTILLASGIWNLNVTNRLAI